MSDGLNVTNAVPPICNRHGESMVLSFYDRPGSAPGNGYVCRSCAKERMVEQTLKLSGKAETSPERAELQVSLLNEIGLTLTALAKEQVAQREVFKCLSLQLQAIDNDLAAKWATRLAQIEERLERIDERGRYTVQQIDALRIVKPRKAGKRPAPKAKVTHKTR